MASRSARTEIDPHSNERAGAFISIESVRITAAGDQVAETHRRVRLAVIHRRPPLREVALARRGGPFPQRSPLEEVNPGDEMARRLDHLSGPPKLRTCASRASRWLLGAPLPLPPVHTACEPTRDPACDRRKAYGGSTIHPREEGDDHRRRRYRRSYAQSPSESQFGVKTPILSAPPLKPAPPDCSPCHRGHKGGDSFQEFACEQACPDQQDNTREPLDGRETAAVVRGSQSTGFLQRSSPADRAATTQMGHAALASFRASQR